MPVMKYVIPGVLRAAVVSRALAQAGFIRGDQFQVEQWQRGTFVWHFGDSEVIERLTQAIRAKGWVVTPMTTGIFVKKEELKP